MTSAEKRFLWVVLLNLLASGCYLLSGLLRSRKTAAQNHRGAHAAARHARIPQAVSAKPYLLKAMVMLLCPVIGPLYFLAGYLVQRLLFYKQVDLSARLFSKTKADLIPKPDEERAKELAPFEEALAVSDKQRLRALTLHILRREVTDSADMLAKALNSTDPETAHYAASALQEVLNDFRLTMQKMTEQLGQEAGNDTGIERRIIDYAERVLKQRVFTEPEQIKYTRMMERAAEAFYRKKPEQLQPEQYEKVCLCLLECRMYPEMERWCCRFAEQYPEHPAAYTCRLKLYFSAGERERFFAVLEELKRAQVQPDRDTLELVRVFC